MRFTEARSCVLDGITLANRVYEEWSDGCWLSGAGVEGFLVAKIGERLHERVLANVSNETVRLESTMGEVGEMAGGRAGEAMPNYLDKILGNSQRLDITLWNSNKQPKGVFEVKRHWNPNGCFHDLLRVAAMVKEHGKMSGGSIEWGFATFFVDRSVRARDSSLTDRVDRYKDELSDRFEDPKFCPKWLSRATELTFKSGPVMSAKKGVRDIEFEGQGVCVAVRPIER